MEYIEYIILEKHSKVPGGLLRDKSILGKDKINEINSYK